MTFDMIVDGLTLLISVAMCIMGLIHMAANRYTAASAHFLFVCAVWLAKIWVLLDGAIQ